MAEIAGLPFWELVFDADGDQDGPARDAVLAAVRDEGITDLVVFAHGWNTEPVAARRLYEAFFGLLAGQLARATGPVSVGLAGVVWPSARWSDEPIPDFTAPAPARAGGGASLGAPPAAVPAGSPALDAATLDSLRALFPTATGPLREMAGLLAAPPTRDAMVAFHGALAEFSRQAGGGKDDDGERDQPSPAGEPRMLLDDPAPLFERYRDALRASGVELASGAGQAGAVGDALRGVMQGAKEALRQATYWQMKNRAGVVGERGLGPLLGRLHALAPQVRVHLVGHSFGARLVSYALAGLPPGPSPVRAVTLLQGAFSHHAFARPLAFDANRNGALAGRLDRIGGPLVVCFSEHDAAVGTFYPLASFAARQDAAAGHAAMFRWGAMGADGAQGVGAVPAGIRPVGSAYSFTEHGVLNVDASEVVRTGGPPTGAHSDIVHPELTWLLLTAGGIC
ncbi:hypothetical protein ACVGOW_21675 [Pseudonocardia saturnea]